MGGVRNDSAFLDGLGDTAGASRPAKEEEEEDNDDEE